jgi:hypothetical protein
MLELWDGTRTNSQMRVQEKINLYNPKKNGGQCRLNGSGAMDLVRTTSSTSFTQPMTFGRKHHSLPIVYYVLPRMDYIQMSFFPETSKWESQNFGHSYLFQIMLFLEMQGKYFIAFKKIFSRVYNMPQSKFIWPLLSKGLWSRVKFSI